MRSYVPVTYKEKINNDIFGTVAIAIYWGLWTYAYIM